MYCINLEIGRTEFKRDSQKSHDKMISKVQDREN